MRLELILIATFVFAGRAEAATYDVNNNVDVCAGAPVNSLRWALAQANANPGADIVRHTVPVTITLACALSITDSTDWRGMNGVVLNGASLPANTNIVTIGGANPQTTTLDTLRISGGPTRGVRQTNPASNVTIKFSTIEKNNFPVAGGYGGGVALEGGNLVVTDSVIAKNSASYGGGIAVFVNAGTLTMRRTTVDSNQANGLAGTGAHGGGVLIYRGPANHLIEYSTISKNKAMGFSGSGGGIALRHLGVSGLLHLDLMNSTVSGNEAVTDGGGIHLSRNPAGGTMPTSIRLRHSTVKDNIAPAGAAAFAGPSCTVALVNSILDDGPNGGQPVCGGTGDFSGMGSIWEDFSCVIAAATNLPGTDPLLAALGSNGGPTKTHLPLAGSPVINTAVDAQCLPNDQRAVARSCCWMGSYENPALCP